MAFPKLSEDVKFFLDNEVLPRMGILKLTSRNRSEVLEFVEFEYEIFLSQNQAEGLPFDQTKLDLAAKTVDELNDVKLPKNLKKISEKD